ncbi:MAG: prephenate dehydrogenase [Treponema sp.]|nr:prephenate dehydrogenase [Treponema sp.]
MGGSFAKSIKKNVIKDSCKGMILAFDKNESVLKQAKCEKVVDEIFNTENLSEMLSRCDIIFLCLYPHSVLNFLKQNISNFKKGAIISDISGVKQHIVSEAKKIIRSDIDFILAHPMAGGETEGFSASSESFFYGRNYILIEQEWNKKENIDIFKTLVKMLGFSRIVESDAKTHDYNIAFTSQLCHVIASALVKSLNDENITRFGGGSFEDLTRIALINAKLWSELFLLNRENLVEHITNFEKEISTIKKYIQSGDSTALEKYLNEVREQRSLMQKNEF